GHRHSDDVRAAVALCLDGGGLVDVGEDHSAKDRAVRVGVLRHHDDADRRLARGGGGHRLIVKRKTLNVKRSSLGSFYLSRFTFNGSVVSRSGSPADEKPSRSSG